MWTKKKLHQLQIVVANLTNAHIVSTMHSAHIPLTLSVSIQNTFNTKYVLNNWIQWRKWRRKALEKTTAFPASPGTTKLQTNMKQSFYKCTQNVVDDGNPVVCTIFVSLISSTENIFDRNGISSWSNIHGIWVDGAKSHFQSGFEFLFFFLLKFEIDIVNECDGFVTLK